MEIADSQNQLVLFRGQLLANFINILYCMLPVSISCDNPVQVSKIFEEIRKSCFQGLPFALILLVH